jgi:flagellar protein FlaG
LKKLKFSDLLPIPGTRAHACAAARHVKGGRRVFTDLYQFGSGQRIAMSELQITTQQAMPHTAGRPVPDAPVVGSGAPVPGINPSAIIAPDPVEVRRQVEEAVQWLNQQVEKLGRSIGFSVDSVAGRNVVTVRDKTSGEVVRQFPDEAILRVAHSIETLKGVLYNDSI